MTTVETYHDFCRSCIQYPPEYALVYPALELANEAGEVVGKIKKVIRGDTSLDDVREAILNELGDVMFPMACLLDYLGYTIHDAIDANVAKLSRRKAAGTIKGSGDDR